MRACRRVFDGVAAQLLGRRDERGRVGRAVAEVALGGGERALDLLELLESAIGPMNWIQPPFDPAVIRFSSSKASSPFSDSQSEPGGRVEREPEAVAAAVGEDLVDVRDDVGELGVGEGRRRTGLLELGDLLRR